MGILIVLPIAAAIALYNNKKIEEFVFLAIGIVITAIFIAGYFGNTLPGVYTGVIMCIIALFYCVYMLAKDRGRFRKCVLTQGFLGVVICICISAAMMLGRKSIGGLSDVCRVYAPQVINMYRYNNLGGGVGSVNYSILYSAPVVQSWCYFCNKLWMQYADDVNLWAHHIFVISGLFPLFVFVEEREWAKTILISLIILTLPNVVADSTCFMNDVPLGTSATYGTIMMIQYSRNLKEKSNIAHLAATSWGMIALCMIKRGGAIFLYGIVSVAVMGLIIQKKRDGFMKIHRTPFLLFAIISVVFPLFYVIYRIINLGKISITDFAVIYSVVIYILMGMVCYMIIMLLNNRENKKTVGIIVGLILLTIISLYIYIITRKNVDEAWLNTYAFFDEWLRVASPEADERRFQYRLSDLSYIVLLILFSVVIQRGIKKRRDFLENHDETIDYFVVPIVLGYFTVVLFTLLDFVRSEWMRKHNNTIFSISRYLGPGILILTVIVIYELFFICKKYNMYCMIGVLIILMMLVPQSYLRLLLDKGASEWEKYENMFSDANIEFNENDKVLCIGTNYYGLYASFPADATWDAIGFTSNESPEEWTKEIIEEGYDYLVVQDYLRGFSAKYSNMFEDGEPTDYSVYKIVIEDSNMRFVRECKEK